jgi:hypothetical protein
MFKSIVHCAVNTTVGVAILAAIAQLPAQAAVFNYVSNLTVTATGNPAPLATSTYSYTKTDAAPDLAVGQFGYKLLDFTATLATPFLSGTYTLADLPTYATQISLLTALVPAEYQGAIAQYQGILPNVLSGATYDYVGDGDFPPPNGSYTFLAQSVPNVSLLSLLFPNGGTINYSSTVNGAPVPGTLDPVDYANQIADLSAKIDEHPVALSIGIPNITIDPVVNSTATPEPMTMLGISLAGAGAAALRRKRKSA